MGLTSLVISKYLLLVGRQPGDQIREEAQMEKEHGDLERSPLSVFPPPAFDYDRLLAIMVPFGLFQRLCVAPRNC